MMSKTCDSHSSAIRAQLHTPAPLPRVLGNVTFSQLFGFTRVDACAKNSFRIKFLDRPNNFRNHILKRDQDNLFCSRSRRSFQVEGTQRNRALRCRARRSDSTRSSPFRTARDCSTFCAFCHIFVDHNGLFPYFIIKANISEPAVWTFLAFVNSTQYSLHIRRCPLPFHLLSIVLFLWS